ncbi:PAS domain-containing protein [Hymenobacter sp. HMF4947]|uniref:histidine kinase n=1 Tax=Hymenobacter ginkgonis TaxID=2682976 RepID=A0A7K1THF2_9BACT|nr:PAS domain-containing protein [Hymenobacter ginkgonis]MVN77782.1 PAS domain-containing protein [Hymenobacter ginkgonis]
MLVAPELGLLFNALPRPYLLLSPELVIEAVSDAYLAATLTLREDLVGQYLFDAFPDNPQAPEAQAVHNLHASLLQVLATGQPHEMAQQHYDVPDPDHPGQFIERHWQPLNAPVLNAHGTVVQLIHSVLDITAQVQGQAYLRASQAREQAARAEAEAQRQRFHEVLMQLPAYVAVYQGSDHIYQFVNPSYQSLFPHRSFLGRPFREGTPESVGLGVVALFDQVYQTGEPYYHHELGGWFDFKGNGQPEQVFLNLYLHPLRDAQGRIDGVLDFSYDVTEQVRARQQVEQLNQELETRVQGRTHELHEQQELLATVNQELLGTNQTLHISNQRLLRTNADLDTFVYTASHDLKSPITNLEGLLAVLRDTLPLDVQQQPLIGPLLGLLDNTVSRFRLTIDQLTELIRLQQTTAGPAQPVLLGPLVAAVQEDLAAEATAAQARLEVTIPDSLSVRFAPANLRSIVYNLLNNALKYRDPARPAQVWVRAERQPAAVVLTVQDNGLGLSESQQQRLFQAFQRLHTHVEGTGVGLYMIKRLIENAGATITVTSTLGVGSTFTVAFPA